MRHLLLIFLFFARPALAQYPSAKLNANVREEIAAEPDRLIPTTEHFVFADDTDVYYRGLGDHDFYHGAGYWMQFRSEAQLNENVRLNVRSIFYSGTNDAGYVQAAANYHLLAVTLIAPGELFGGRLSLRGPDLDRQTMGAGLMIQDKEMNGALLSWDREGLSVILRADDTGLFRQNDDTYNAQVVALNGYVGAGAIVWPQGIEQDHLTHERGPYGYLYSRHTFDWFSYAAEIGERAGADAGLVSATAQQDWRIGTTQLRILLKGEFRRYAAGFANDFAGLVQNQYISYDQYDKDFTNAANVFVYGDDVNVEAGHLNLWWKLSPTWRLHSLNEVGQFAFATRDVVPYYYFRQGAEYCPMAGEEDCLNLFVSNKVLTDSFTRPPTQVSLENAPLFSMYPFIGMELRFRL